MGSECSKRHDDDDDAVPPLVVFRSGEPSTPATSFPQRRRSSTSMSSPTTTAQGTPARGLGARRTSNPQRHATSGPSSAPQSSIDATLSPPPKSRKVLRIPTTNASTPTANPLKKPTASSFQSVVDGFALSPLSPRSAKSGGRRRSDDPTAAPVGAGTAALAKARSPRGGAPLSHQSSPQSATWTEALATSGRSSRRSEDRTRSVKFEKTAVRFAALAPGPEEFSINGHSAANFMNPAYSPRQLDDQHELKHLTVSSEGTFLQTAFVSSQHHRATPPDADAAAAAALMFTSIGPHDSRGEDTASLMDSFDAGNGTDDDDATTIASDDVVALAATAVPRMHSSRSRSSRGATMLWSIGAEGQLSPPTQTVAAAVETTSQAQQLMLASDDFTAGECREDVTSSPMSYRELDLEHVRSGGALLVPA